MHNNIDKDIRLFIPPKSELLLFGGNFLFSKRLYELVKRNSNIKRIDFKDQIETPNRIKGLIEYYNSNTFIFTSELFLNLDQSNFLKFKELISTLKINLDLKFIFISVSKPLKTNLLPEYHLRIQEIKNILNIKKDLFYEFPSFITYVDSNIEDNPIGKLSKNDNINDTYLADDIIKDIVENFNNVGKISFNKDNNTQSFKEAYNYVENQSKCSLGIIYRKKPQEVVNGRSIADWRFELGSALKQTIPINIINELDLIVPIPETGKYYAQGLASSLNKDYVEAFYKKSEIGRSFDIKDTKKRQEFIDSKLGLISNLVDKKNIGIVDEAIFTGATLKTVSNLLKNTQVGKVYFFIPTPECRFRCNFNMQPDRELLLETVNKEDLATYFNIEDIYFQNLPIFSKILSTSGYKICCFSNYSI